MQRAIIIGTAGHIDHGKSALVKQLTGTDPDRLREEKERQLTIDLGFAFLTDQIAIIDVPGHEKFIKNMVAGAATVDLALLVIAADDGVMSQTREHLDIMGLLDIPTGIIVITKIDLAEAEWLRLVAEDVRCLVKGSFLEKAPIHQVSAKSGVGISELKDDLIRLARRFQRRTATDLFRMPVDRSFTVKGFGTVVTGSVISGSVSVGKRVELLPAKKEAGVRHMQSHQREVRQVKAGDRAAINLAGIAKEAVRRGDYLGSPGFFESTDLLTVWVQLLPEATSLEFNIRVRIHIGTGEVIGRLRLIGRDRLAGGQAGVAQLKLDQTLSAGFRDRFILRTYSPLHTIGGGMVLEITPEQVRKKDVAYAQHIEVLKDADLKSCIVWLLETADSPLMSKIGSARKFSADLQGVTNTLRELQQNKTVKSVNDGYILTKRLAALKETVLQHLSAFHRSHPLSLGMHPTELFTRLRVAAPLREYLIASLEKEGALCIKAGKIARRDFQVRLNLEQSRRVETLEKRIRQAGFSPPDTGQLQAEFSWSSKNFEQYLGLLKEQGKIVILEQGLVFHKEVIRTGVRKIRDFLEQNQKAVVSTLKDLLGTSRKYALPLLNYYDQIGLTIRKGNNRYLK